MAVNSILSALSAVCLLSWRLGDCVSSTAPEFPFQDPTLSWDKRADDLVARLTLEEMVPQTLAVYGSHTPAIPRLGIKPYVWITECMRGQANTNTTAFPQSIGLAASFRYRMWIKLKELQCDLS